MQHSEHINELAGALAKAQMKIVGAVKDAKNPHFRSDYATLQSVWDACHTHLNENGIAIIQGVSTDSGCVVVTTQLAHASGQWIADALTLPVTKQDAQGYGSAITYGRRYGLAAIAGVAPADDDGNAAVGGKGDKPKAVNAALLDEGRTASLEGTESLKKWWGKLSKDQKVELSDEMASLKDAAAKADAELESFREAFDKGEK